MHIVDPRELELPAVGLLGVVDTETGKLMHVQTNSVRLRERYRIAAAARQEHITQTLRAAGAKVLTLSTDRDWLLDIARFAAGTRRRESLRTLDPRTQP